MLKSRENLRPTRHASLLAAFMLAALLGSASATDATVFYAREDLDALAFPGADHVEARDVFLTPDERARIERRAGSRLDSDLVTVYVGRSAGRILGYAFLDTHLVRTLPETLLVVLADDGRLASTYVVAFHEPLEYLPDERWLALLEQRGLSEDLRVGRAIAGITGSTLSARAVIAGVRRALALYEELLTES